MSSLFATKTPAFGAAISVVVCDSPEPKVSGIATARVVTFVTDDHAFRDRTIREFPCQAVSIDRSILDLDKHVPAVGVPKSGDLPTRIGTARLVDATLQALCRSAKATLLAAAWGAESLVAAAGIYLKRLTAPIAGQGDTVDSASVRAESSGRRFGGLDGKRLSAAFASDLDGHNESSLGRASWKRWGAVPRVPLVNQLARPVQALSNVSRIIPRLVVDLADAEIHIESEHPNGSLIVLPVLATALGED